MSIKEPPKKQKGNVYRLDRFRNNKRREKVRSDAKRSGLDRRPTRGRNLPRAKRGLHPVLVFLAAVVLFVLVSRWLAQLSVP
jgi:hypothetical protein